MNTILKTLMISIGLVSSVPMLAGPQNCPLCNNGMQLQKKHIDLYGEEVQGTNILFESSHFYVAVDNYPVCEDHILIVPKDHVCSYSVVNSALEYELDAIIKTLSEFIGTDEYGLFEHGSNMVGLEQKACGNSVYHAHMHFIPYLNVGQKELFDLCFQGDPNQVISLKKEFEIRNYCFCKERHQSYLNFLKSLPTKNPYLFCYFSNSAGMSLCIPDNIIQNGVPSQFFRRVFAEYFQKGEASPFWNWKKLEDLQGSKIFRTKVVKNTVEKFSDKVRLESIFEKHLGLC